MPDGYELNSGLNPLLNDASEDPDNDTLSNLEEYQLGTNPQNPDTDGDGVNDAIDDKPTINIAAILIPIFHLLLN